jgi:flavin-dependent dehydrogenase
MEIAIIGGGIVGLALALNLHQRGLTCRTGDRPFINVDDFISQEELRALSDRYTRIAGYSIEQLGTPVPHPRNRIRCRKAWVVGNLPPPDWGRLMRVAGAAEC